MAIPPIHEHARKVTPKAVLIVDGAYMSQGQTPFAKQTGRYLDTSVEGINRFVALLESFTGLVFEVGCGG